MVRAGYTSPVPGTEPQRPSTPIWGWAAVAALAALFVALCLTSLLQKVGDDRRVRAPARGRKHSAQRRHGLLSPAPAARQRAVGAAVAGERGGRGLRGGPRSGAALRVLGEWRGVHAGAPRRLPPALRAVAVRHRRDGGSARVGGAGLGAAAGPGPPQLRRSARCRPGLAVAERPGPRAAGHHRRRHMPRLPAGLAGVLLLLAQADPVPRGCRRSCARRGAARQGQRAVLLSRVAGDRAALHAALRARPPRACPRARRTGVGRQRVGASTRATASRERAACSATTS